MKKRSAKVRVPGQTGEERIGGDAAYVLHEYLATGEVRCAVCGVKTGGEEGGYVYCDGCSGEATGDYCYAAIVPLKEEENEN
jgi:hypothetical protein